MRIFAPSNFDAIAFPNVGWPALACAAAYAALQDAQQRVG